MLVGGGICLVGVAVTVVTYKAAKGGGTYTVAYGAIAVGAIQFLYGLFKFLGERAQPATGSNPVMLALHAMVYVTSGQGPLTEEDKRKIETLLQSFSGWDFPLDDDHTLAKMGRNPPDQTEVFLQEQRQLDRNQKEFILRAAIVASIAVGRFFGGGGERIASVGTALGFSMPDQEALVQEIWKAALEKADERPTLS